MAADSDAVTGAVTLSDGNSEPLSLALSARPLPADSGPGSNECDDCRGRSGVAAGPTGLKFPKSHTKIKFPKGDHRSSATMAKR